MVHLTQEVCKYFAGLYLFCASMCKYLTFSFWIQLYWAFFLFYEYHLNTIWSQRTASKLLWTRIAWWAKLLQLHKFWVCVRIFFGLAGSHCGSSIKSYGITTPGITFSTLSKTISDAGKENQNRNRSRGHNNYDIQIFVQPCQHYWVMKIERRKVFLDQIVKVRDQRLQ